MPFGERKQRDGRTSVTSAFDILTGTKKAAAALQRKKM
jgi:hypothetical protein